VSSGDKDAVTMTMRAYVGDWPHPIEASLKTIVESEGVRVHVERLPGRRCIGVETCLVRESYRSWFEVSDAEIEGAETGAMVQHVVEKVREQAPLLRRAAADDAVSPELEASPERCKAMSEFLVSLICDNATPDVCETLAIALMEHVERLGK
jgi:hypothetical protein